MPGWVSGLYEQRPDLHGPGAGESGSIVVSRSISGGDG